MADWTSVHGIEPRKRRHSSFINMVPAAIALFFAVLLSQIRDFLRPQRPSEEPKADPAPPPISPITTLPTEILQHIATFLPTTSVASFALCSRGFCRTIGSQAWRDLQDPASAAEKHHFLSILERDLPDLVHCHHCIRLHRREAYEALQRQSWKVIPPRLKECIKRDTIQYRWAPDYNLHFRWCQLVMKAYRYGPRYGIPVAALTHVHSESRERSSSQVFFSARIDPVADELILRHIYRVVIPSSKDIADLRWHHVEICPHLAPSRCGQRLKCLLVCKLNHWKSSICHTCSGLLQCGHCVTEFLLEVEDSGDSGHIVYVTTWENLGPCRSPHDPKWWGHAYDMYRRCGSVIHTPKCDFEAGSIRQAFEQPGSIGGIPQGPRTYLHKFSERSPPFTYTFLRLPVFGTRRLH